MSDYAVLLADPARAGPSGDRVSRSGLRQTKGPMHITLFAVPGLAWIAGAKSLLIGRLFDRESLAPVGDGDALDRALADGPGPFIRRYWGSYVLVAEVDGQLSVLRDPSGGMPCHIGGGDRRNFLASGAGIAVALGLFEDACVDRAFMAHWLRFPFLRSARTGLVDVEEVMPGAILALGTGRGQDLQLWRPAAFTLPAPREFDEAATELRRIAKACVPLAAGEGPLLAQVSGGLDSSILAACLAAKRVPMHAVTFATSSPDGDERHYAQALTRHLGIRLEVLEEAQPSCETSTAPSFRPASNILLEGIDRAVEQFRQSIDAPVVVDGGGGDSLFGFSRTAAAVLDGLKDGHGWEALHAVAERSATSLWQVVRVAIRQAMRRPVPWLEDRRFLGDAGRVERADDHPWLAEVSRLSPGQREHLLSLVHIQHFLDRHTIGGEHRHPLMIQPLLEYCLSVPSWMWNAGGRDRAVARRAFEDSLPPIITARRTKGSLQGYFHRRFRALKPVLRELLLDGELAATGLIDRKAIETALSADDGPDDEIAMRLSEIATLERWLTSWRRAGAR